MLGLAHMWGHVRQANAKQRRGRAGTVGLWANRMLPMSDQEFGNSSQGFKRRLARVFAGHPR